MKKYFLSLVVTALFVGAGCSVNKSATLPTTGPVNGSQPVATAPVEKKVSEQTSGGVKECGSDWTCLADAANTCTLAHARVAYAVDMFGVNYAFNDTYEIKGSVNGKCSFYLKTNDVKVSYGAEAKKGMLAQGTTESQLVEFENKGTVEAQASYKGKDATCAFAQTSALVNLLKKWQGGDRVSVALGDVATCVGPLTGSSTSASGSAEVKIGN